jgi:hypothetical protein
MMRRLPVLPRFLFLSGTLVALFAGEATAGNLAAPAVDPRVYDGEIADTCIWASLPAFSSNPYGCSSVLIHPQVVVTRAACAHDADDRRAAFGEFMYSPAHAVYFEECWIPDDYTPIFMGAHPADIAFCKLPVPVDLPYTPPAFGCELEQLTTGAEVAVVGFGARSEANQSGSKSWKFTELLSDYQTDPFALFGDTDPVMCRGDQGAPALIELPDGSWRAFAIGVHGALDLGGQDGPCGSLGTSKFIWLHEWIPWAEAQIGIDLTPCHDADGSWNPTPMCQGFVVDPFDPGNSDWDQWCAGAPVSGPGTSCGPAMEPDVVPPNVSITAPTNQSHFEGPLAQLDIVVEADDGEWPVDGIELLIDGELVAFDDVPPWAFNQLEFPQGSWTLVARAVDLSGNVAESEPVEIHVGDEPPASDTDDTADTGDTGDTGDTEETGGTGIDGQGTGCALTADRDAGRVTSVVFFALLLLGRRRMARPTNLSPTPRAALARLWS